MATGFFSFLSGTGKSAERLPIIFPMALLEKDFVAIDCETIYKRILIDVFERTEGLTEDMKVLLWDNCLGSEKQDGLITMLAKAMTDKAELYLVYRADLKVVRKADTEETTKIRDDYKAKGESATGVYVTFKNFRVSDMVKLYSALEYCGINSFWKSMNLSKALQIKVSELRSSTGLNDKADIEKQAVEIAKALSLGLDIYIDAKDVLELLNPDLTATNSAMELIEKKRSFYLGLPASYLQGDASAGLNDSGKGDAKKVEQGLKPYYFSIGKPICKGLFKTETTFESDDSDQIMASMEVLKTFSITDDVLISEDNKRKIINRMVGLPEDEKGDAPEPLPTGELDAQGKPVVDPTKAPAKPGAAPVPPVPPKKA